MTIELTEDEFEEQFQEVNEEKLQWDTSDELDVVRKFDARVSHGWRRDISLRESIWLRVDRHQLTDRLIINCPEQGCRNVRLSFTISGQGQIAIASKPNETIVPIIGGKYSLRSNGLHPRDTGNHSDAQLYSFLQIEIPPSVLCSFVASPEGELPKYLRHLVRPLSQEVYQRTGDAQPAMITVLQQILRCPYQGLIKRAYLESKVIELMALMLDHEVVIQQGKAKKNALKPEQIERIYYAREILLRDLNNPPSLEELARQAGLNDFLLKKGFRQAFGMTVFGELRSHRLDLAKQLLAEQDMTVSEVAQRVGYADLRAFARAFKHKFGTNPKEYQKACR